MTLTRRTLLKSGAALACVAGTAGKAMARLPETFIVPAEEDPHELTFMQWPVSRFAYLSKSELRAVQRVIAEIANTIAEFEPVAMLVGKRAQASARKLLSAKVELWNIPTNDLWCRDSGPLFARDTFGQRAVSLIHFNGWGRYNHPKDERVAEDLAYALDLPVFNSGLVGEPGGAETNGHGLVMANASSWINRNRNPGLSKDTVTERLRRAYGADRVIWGPGVKGLDVTDAHIDGMARFTAPTRVLMQYDDTAPDDPYNKAADVLLAQLKAANLEIETIPYSFDNRLKDIGYYVNYYVCNGAVLMSEFGDTTADAIAKEAISRHYPGREVICLNTDTLIELGGGIHCATQQFPAALS